MGLRISVFVLMLAALVASAYTFVGKARSGELNPVEQVDAAAARGELASAQYVLGIVESQLAQVKTLSGSYGGTLQFDKFPLVTLVRAGESSYCVEFEKTHVFKLEGPGGDVVPGSC